MESFLVQFQSTSWLEWIAVILALAYVYFAAKQNIWCWPSALISTAIYTWLFWSVSLPFHTVLNAYYLIMAVYGWRKWNSSYSEALAVKVWPWPYHLSSIVLLSFTAWALSYFASSVLDADYLYLDAFVTVFSVFTTFLVTHKVRENWLYWIVINVFGAYLYFAKGLSLTGVLYLFYAGFAIYGFIQWRIQPSVVEDNKVAT
ncbi:nicotinamide riboside transporter PnuC [Paraglaciecola sp.]|uniref:nicotinamide riboside transporter PnuC n=1 Tax=Paraglaciecola sp. TaxID=1920173 RepID=UPI003263F488